jgi:hypothetical protein
MLKSLRIIVLSLTTLLSGHAVAQDYMLTPGVGIEYELPPQQPQMFSNYLFWTVDAYCKIITEDVSNDLFIRAIVKKGKINDTVLIEGQTMLITVYPAERLKISADSGARVEVTNLGQHLVRVSCSSS